MLSRAPQTLIVGIVVLLALVGGVGTLIFLSGGGTPTERYYVIYDNVSGIEPGTEVLFEGFDIGHVANVEPIERQGQRLFRIALDVRADWRLPSDSTVQLTPSGLFSGLVVNISRGDSRTMLEPGATLAARESPNLMDTMSNLSTDIAGLTNQEIGPLLEQLNTLMVDVNRSATRLPRIMADLQSVTTSLSDAAPVLRQELETAGARVNNDILSQKNVDSIELALGDLRAASRDLSRLTADLSQLDLDRGVAEATRLLETLNRIAEENGPLVNEALTSLTFSLDTVEGSIESMTYNLDGASRNLLELSRSLRQNPSLLIRGSGPPDEAASRGQ
jgi:phospholipid/cholesterol/gamma-HCH transport system substrate-binding protein